jgi:prevent-host-death family protein
VKAIPAAEANRRFSELLRKTQEGETFLVTSRGQPIATIAPADRALTEREAAKQRLLRHLDEQETLNVPRWTREELYDD